MQKLIPTFLILLCSVAVQSQNIGIGTATPSSKLQINHRTTAASPTLRLFDSTAGTGSSILFAKESQSNSFSVVSTIGTFAATNTLDFRTTFNSGILLRGDGRVGINNITSPTATLHVGGGVKINDTLNVTGDANLTGKLKFSGNAGEEKQVLISNGITSSPTWENISSVDGSSVGFGSWGDCANTANIAEYNPVAEVTPEDGNTFGYSVAISGDYAIIGIPYDDIGANAEQGSADIFHFDGTNWIFLQKVFDATGAANDFFGFSVSISGNYAIVGAPNNSTKGSVSIYQLSGGSWTLLQKISDATGLANDGFGHSVCVSGNYLIAGAPGDDVGTNADAGSVSIFQLTGGTWALMQKITDATGLAIDDFGYSVSISGSVAIVGSPFDDEAADVNVGSASIYKYNGTTWQLANKSFGAGAGDSYGYAVSISGNYAVIGSPYFGDNDGRVTIKFFNGTVWQTNAFVSGDQDWVGSAVYISDNYILAGTYSGNHSGTNTSPNREGVLLLQKIGGGLWKKMQYINNPALEGRFGFSLAIDGTSKRFLIGEPIGAFGFGSFIPLGKSAAFFGKVK
jgi:FG-GAP repeat